MEVFKKEYVFLLQSTVQIPIHSSSYDIQVKLFGGNVHEERVKKLLDEARRIDPKLPTFERLVSLHPLKVCVDMEEIVVVLPLIDL